MQAAYLQAILFAGLTLLAQYLPSHWGIPIGIVTVGLALWKLGLVSWQLLIVIAIAILLLWYVLHQAGKTEQPRQSKEFEHTWKRWLKSVSIVVIIGVITFGFILPKVNNQTTILGMQLSHPSPQEILDNIYSLPPYLQDNARDSYKGLSVTWAVNLFSFTSYPDGEQIFSNPSEQTLPLSVVTFVIDIDDYPQMKIMKEGQQFIVQGTIISVDSTLIRLGECHLTFP